MSRAAYRRVMAGTARVSAIATILVATLALSATPGAYAGVQGCVVSDPANPVSPNPCTYTAGDAGLYTAVGDWRLTVERGGTTIVYSSKSGSPGSGPLGTIEPGDVVTGTALTPASEITFGNPSPLARPASPGMRGASGCDASRPALAYHAGAQAAHAELRPYACLFRTGHYAGEPTLGVTAAGSIFFEGVTFDSPTASFGPPAVLRSRDGGASWQDVSPQLPAGVPAHPASGDPYLYVDKRTSRVFTADYVFAGQPAPGECSFFSFASDSDAQAPGWTNSLAGCEESDHETVFAGPPAPGPTGLRPVGYPDVVYYCAAAAGNANFSTATLCDRSLDGGRSFSVTGAPAFTDDPRQPDGDYGVPGACEGESGHGVVGPDGTIYLPRSWCGHPWLAISRDEGLTWRHTQVSTMRSVIDSSGRREHEAGVTVDSRGDVFYFWIGHDRLPYLAISRDGGAHFGKPLMVAPPDVTETAMPAIDSGPHGGLELVFLGSTNAPGPPFPETDDCTPTPAQPTRPLDCLGQNQERTDEESHYAKTTWNGYIAVTGDPLAKDPLFYATSANDPSDPLHRGACVHECGADAPGAGGEFDFLGVFADRYGTPWSAYVDGCEGSCVSGGSDNANEGVVGKLVGGPRL